MNSRAFFPFRKPVRLICIILPSGFYNTHIEDGERERAEQWGEELNERQEMRKQNRTERMGSDWSNLILNTNLVFTVRCLLLLF